MKFIARLLTVALLSLLPTLAFAQSRLQNYQPGPRLIDGTQLNKMVGAINLGVACPSYHPGGTPAATDAVFFIATRRLQVISISEVHSVAAGGASVLQVVKDTGTSAPGAGTDLLTNNSSTGFDLNGTANTVQVGTLVATAGVTTLAVGDRLSVDYANTIQSSAGIVVTVCLAPLQ